MVGKPVRVVIHEAPFEGEMGIEIPFEKFVPLLALRFGVAFYANFHFYIEYPLRAGQGFQQLRNTPEKIS